REASAAGAADGSGKDESALSPLTLSLRLTKSEAPYRRDVATVVPPEESTCITRLLYTLHTRVLEGLSVALHDARPFLIDPRGIEGVPLGRSFSEAGDGVYVPAGTTLVTTVSPEVISELVHGDAEGHAFFLPRESAPLCLSSASFTPPSTRVITDVS